MALEHNSSCLEHQRQIKSDDNTSCLVPQRQKTSVHKSKELRIQDNRNEHLSLTLVPNDVPTADKTNTSLQELGLPFGTMYEEYFNKGHKSVSKSSALYNNLHQQDTQPTFNVLPTLEPIIPPTDFNAKENNNNQAEYAPYEAYEFINPFAPPRTKVAKSSLRDPMQTRRKLATDPEMYTFTLTVSKAEMKNIKEAMSDHA
uniref:Uncharacterized protein n=1 Tax=Tanacetum cinerariifolium TaxID=118510 RepID=A0A699HC37_TANCI|nr:hypothetical protein [Tanacetum cinerariifolium]GEX85459.1 hypothetical protein [Tanacetum cinerariifolium]